MIAKKRKKTADNERLSKREYPVGTAAAAAKKLNKFARLLEQTNELNQWRTMNRRNMQNKASIHRVVHTKVRRARASKREKRCRKNRKWKNWRQYTSTVWQEETRLDVVWSAEKISHGIHAYEMNWYFFSSILPCDKLLQEKNGDKKNSRPSNNSNEKTPAIDYHYEQQHKHLIFMLQTSQSLSLSVFFGLMCICVR